MNQKDRCLIIGTLFFLFITIWIFSETQDETGTISKILIYQALKIGNISNLENSIIRSADGKRSAFMKSIFPLRKNTYRLIIDGKEIEKYDVSQFPVFSPDSKKIAYIAFSKKKTNGGYGWKRRKTIQTNSENVLWAKK